MSVKLKTFIRGIIDVLPLLIPVVPFGIIYKENKPTYEQMMKEQIELSIKSKGKGDLNKLILGPNSWEVK